MKKNLLKTLLAITLIAVMCFSIVSFAGCNPGLFINVPETLEAELGVYMIPDYDVVNANGMIMAGYDVRLKSVTDSSGKKIDFDQNSVTVNEKGVYKFVYGARGVKDATVNIDFADRTPPTVNFNANNLPSFFITGNSYRIPAYTLSGDYVREKCTVKVVHIADDKTEKEVEIKSNRFNVTETSGSYEIRIHVEDAVGNYKDYAYSRPVDGPEKIKENTIIYFDEAFGERQVYCLEAGYTGRYVSNGELGDKAREGDDGAYKVTFNGSETTNNEGYISLKTPAILDVNGYSELEMYVYNDSENDAIFGATWWNDTNIPKGEWTRISFSVDNWGHCTWADNSTKIVSTNDISNMGLRFIFAYDHETLPSGTFYLSPLRGVPRIPSEVTAGEDVTLDKSSYSIGSVVNLTAAEKDGQVVDCFLVDGKPIVGDSFVVIEEQHNVTVKYADELTFDTMTWATGFYNRIPNSNWTVKNNIGAEFIGSSDKWVISTNVVGGYNENTGGQTLNISWMIGDIESIELQCFKDGGSFKWYFDGTNWNANIAKLTAEQFNKLKNASEENPVNIQVMRNGDLILILIDGEFAGRSEIKSGLSSNAFGIGYRKEGADRPDTVLLADTKAVMGEERTELYYATLTSAVEKGSENVSTDKESYRLGEVAHLTAKDKDDGTVLGYFTVDGHKIIGNSFVVTKREHTVDAVYVNLSKITFLNGVTALEGDRVGVGTNLTLSHGEAPEQGKIFDYFLVDGTIKVYGNVFTVTSENHEIDAVWSDSDNFGWGYVEENDETLDYVNIMGNDASDWTNWGLDGYVFGKSEYWAVKVYVKHTREWNSLEFVQGSKQSIRIRFHSGGFLGVVLLDNNSETLPDGHYKEGEFVEAYPHQNVPVVNKLKEGATLTCIRYKDTITIYVNDVPFFTTEYAVDHTGNWFGIGHIDAEAATKPDMNNIQFVMGKDKLDAYIDKNWKDVTIEKDDNVLLDKEHYKQYNTVKLTAKEAPQGKIFSHFTVNGNKIDGNSFVADELNYEIKAVYVNISKLELGTGIKTSDGKNVYPQGTTVTLIFNGTVPQGMFFDCFKVDGEKINGNSFLASLDNHKIEAVFASSANEMTWTELPYQAPQGGDQKTLKVGEGTNWVFTYKLYGLQGSGWNYVGMYVGGNKFLGYELNVTSKFSGYGAPWIGGDGGWNDGVALSDEVVAMLRGASEGSPVTAIYIRQGNVFKAFLKDGSKTVWIANVTKAQLGLENDSSFGLGEREGPGNAVLTDINYVIGRDKTDAFIATLAVTLNKTDVTTGSEKYYLGDTVTLTAAPAPEGKKFSHFEVDDVRIKGNSFVAIKSAYKVVAVYDDISVIESGAGITTSDGETEYVRGETVTLKYDKTSLGGKLFDYFTVDGSRIVGDTFVTTAAKHTVAIVTVDTVNDLTWVTSDEANGQTAAYDWSGYSFNGVSLGRSDHWVIEAETYAFTSLANDWYSVDFLVGTSATIQIRLHPNLDEGGVQIVPMRKGIDDGKLFVKYQNGNGGGETAKTIIDACSAATEAAPVTFTCVRSGNEFYVMFNGKMIAKTDFAFEVTDNAFGIGGTDCGAWLTNHPTYTYRYRTGEEIAASKTTSKVTGTNVTFDKADGIYALGETVTLTADAAQEGFVFSHFTVNGERIDGNSFVVTENAVKVVAVYEDERQIVVENKPNDGAIVKITNDEYTLPKAKITDKNGNEITSLSVGVAVTDAARNSYEIVGGKIILSYRGAIDVTVTYSSGELGKEVSFTVALQRSDGNIITEANETGVKTVDANGNKVSFDSAVKHGEDVGSLKVSDIVSNETGVFLSTWDISDYKFIEFYAFTEDAGVKMGGWWCNDTDLVQNQWTKVIIDKTQPNFTAHDNKNVLRIMGISQGKTVWISTVKAYGTDGFTQINDISVSHTTEEGMSSEWVTNVRYDGEDKNVADNGSLKITTVEGENYVISDKYYIKNLADYKEVYFYVYAEKATSASAGGWWCGDTALVEGSWTKITLTREMDPQNVDSKGIFSNGVYSFVFRIKDAAANEVFYITSLYAVPNA